MRKLILISLSLILLTSCLKIRPPKPKANDNFQTFQDPRDGQKYKIIPINTQTWFAENLRYAGAIPEVRTPQSWASTKDPAWSHYENNPTQDAIYGKLYNGYSVKSGGLCPPGWHIPTTEEFTELVNYLGGFLKAGIKMRALKGWEKYDPNNEWGTNVSGWSGLPGGFRESNGDFGGIEGNGFWWTSSPNGSGDDLWGWILYPNGDVNRFPESSSTGRSCRCVKD